MAFEEGRIIEVPLTKGYIALVNQFDYYKVSTSSWYAHQVKEGTGVVYAIRRIKTDGRQRIIKMHREILGILDFPKISVDHIDMNGLNNCRSNLRLVSGRQNQANIGSKKKRALIHSKYKGVYFSKVSGKWAASVAARKKKYT